MLLGIGLGNDLDHAFAFHRGKPLQAQRGQQDLVAEGTRHRSVGDDVELALDARINEEVLPGDLAHGMDNRIDLGILEIERDGLFTLLGAGRHAQREQNGNTTRTQAHWQQGEG
ncbi:hypothetical protein TMEC50S_00187 [Thauera mechernichensis]